MKRIVFIAVVIVLFSSSCVNTKKINNIWVYKNQELYFNYDKEELGDRMPVSHIKTYISIEGFAAKLKETDGELIYKWVVQ